MSAPITTAPSELDRGGPFTIEYGYQRNQSETFPTWSATLARYSALLRDPAVQKRWGEPQVLGVNYTAEYNEEGSARLCDDGLSEEQRQQLTDAQDEAWAEGLESKAVAR